LKSTVLSIPAEPNQYLPHIENKGNLKTDRWARFSPLRFAVCIEEADNVYLEVTSFPNTAWKEYHPTKDTRWAEQWVASSAMHSLHDFNPNFDFYQLDYEDWLKDLNSVGAFSITYLKLDDYNLFNALVLCGKFWQKFFFHGCILSNLWTRHSLWLGKAARINFFVYCGNLMGKNSIFVFNSASKHLRLQLFQPPQAEVPPL
jgi:hypothetical protein